MFHSNYLPYLLPKTDSNTARSGPWFLYVVMHNIGGNCYLYSSFALAWLLLRVVLTTWTFLISQSLQPSYGTISVLP